MADHPGPAGWLALQGVGVVLLGAMLPDMDHVETYRRIKAQAELADIPLLFMGARCDSEPVYVKLGVEVRTAVAIAASR